MLTDDEKEMADFLAGAPYRATALADMARELAGKVAGTYADVHLMADALRHHAAALTAAAERERVLREACEKIRDGAGMYSWLEAERGKGAAMTEINWASSVAAAALEATK